MKTKLDKKDKLQTDSKYKLFELLPIILILFFIPLIVFLKVIPVIEEYYRIWTPQQQFFDFFSYYKMFFLMIFSFFAFVMFVARLVRNGMDAEKKNIYYVCLILYSILVMLSAYFSKYQEVAVFGFLDRNEGMLTILAYSFMCYYTFYMLESYEDIKKVLYGLMASTIVICTIGIFQYWGMDFFKSDLGKNLILPTAQNDMLKTLEFRYANYVIYSTLFHYNYVGSFTALVLPIFLILGMFINKIKWNAFYIVLSALIGVVWLACGARSGVVGVLVAFVLMFFLFWKTFRRNSKIIIPYVLIALLALTIIAIVSKNILAVKFTNTISEFKHGAIEKEKLSLKNIKISDHELQLIANELPIKLTIDKDYNLKFFDLSGNKLAYNWDKTGTNAITFNNPEYKNYDIKAVNFKSFQVLIIKKDDFMLFVGMEKSIFTLLSPGGVIINYGPVESFGFNNMEKMASARGYIWSRTIPLLKHTFLLGYGPDNFIFYFPQNDLIGKLYAYGNMWMSVDKAHNFYLQQAVNNGVLALISLITIFVTYIRQSWKLYNDCDTKDKLNILGLGIYLGISSFLATWVFNDSALSISPVFWVILGVGMAVNRLVVSNKKVEN